MTLNECSTADDAITAALVQGLHAFMAAEAKAAATDDQLEAAGAKAQLTTPNSTTQKYNGGCSC